MSNKKIIQKNILLSIKPKYARRIKSREKKWEFRKQIWSNNKIINKIYLYETSPTQQLIGYFTTNKIITGKPSKVWKLIPKDKGISKEAFFEYFQKSSIAYALEITTLSLFRKQISPHNVIHNFHAPQNFMYVDLNIKEVKIEDETLLTEFIGCKISKDLREGLEQIAKEHNKNLSEYIRKFIREGLNKVKSKHKLKKPSLNPPPNINLKDNNTTIIKNILDVPNSPYKEVINELKEHFEKGKRLQPTPLPKNYKHYYNDKRELRIIKLYIYSFKKLSQIFKKNYKERS